MKTLISIIGPTAVGKTALSIALAQHFQTEIISCDARQFYQGMDIGTAKATLAEQAMAKHHFIDCLRPDEVYTAGAFEKSVTQCLETLMQTQDVVIMVGGSTLYAHAVWHGIDEMPDIPPAIREELNLLFVEKGLAPLLEELQQVDAETYQTIDLRNHVRIIRALEVFRATGTPISVFRQKKSKPTPYQHLKIGLNAERSLLYSRIDARVLQMWENGLEAEVKTLLSLGYDPQLPSMQAIGYAETVQYLKGEINKDTAIDLIQQHSRNYAKRQITFFKREEGLQWIWVDEEPNPLEKVLYLYGELNK